MRATGASSLFSANVPEKLIRDVAGHRLSALHLYERPTLEQKQSVSQVLVQSKNAFEEAKKENRDPFAMKSVPTQPCSSVGFHSIFTGLSNCNVVVNVGTLLTVPAPVPCANTAEDLFRGIDIDDFFKS